MGWIFVFWLLFMEASTRVRPQINKVKSQINMFLGGRAFIKHVMFRVQSAPLGKMTFDLRGSRNYLHVSDPLKATSSKVRSTFFRV